MDESARGPQAGLDRGQATSRSLEEVAWLKKLLTVYKAAGNYAILYIMYNSATA